MYTSPIAGDEASFGWLCWLMLIDSIIYFIIGVYVRMVFPGMSRILEIPSIRHKTSMSIVQRAVNASCYYH